MAISWQGKGWSATTAVRPLPTPVSHGNSCHVNIAWLRSGSVQRAITDAKSRS
jgi:hypothetical protein